VLGLAAICLIIVAASFAALGVGLNFMNQDQTNNPIIPPTGTMQSPQPTIQPTNELVPDWEVIGGSWIGPDENGLVYGKTASFDGDALYLFKNTYSDFTFSATVQALTREASLAIRMSDDGKTLFDHFHSSRSEGGKLFWPSAFRRPYLPRVLRRTCHGSGYNTVDVLGADHCFSERDQVINYEDVDNPYHRKTRFEML
jgi:hypothetical protein